MMVQKTQKVQFKTLIKMLIKYATQSILMEQNMVQKLMISMKMYTIIITLVLIKGILLLKLRHYINTHKILCIHRIKNQVWVVHKVVMVLSILGTDTLGAQDRIIMMVLTDFQNIVIITLNMVFLRGVKTMNSRNLTVLVEQQRQNRRWKLLGPGKYKLLNKIFNRNLRQKCAEIGK